MPKTDLNLPESKKAIKMIADARLGDSTAINDLMGRIYPELKRRAQWQMKAERPGHTFGPSGSELVQRVMEKILEGGGQIFEKVDSEQELIRILTRHMRFILVDYARSSTKHGKPSPRARVAFDDVVHFARVASVNLDEVLFIHEALLKLAEVDADAATALELRQFAGLTNEEAAGAMGVNVAKFRRTLGFARAFVEEFLQRPVL
jgi:RNA polymerase sigma factor (TIGR02999 family)